MGTRTISARTGLGGGSTGGDPGTGSTDTAHITPSSGDWDMSVAGDTVVTPASISQVTIIGGGAGAPGTAHVVTTGDWSKLVIDTTPGNPWYIGQVMALVEGKKTFSAPIRLAAKFDDLNLMTAVLMSTASSYTDEEFFQAVKTGGSLTTELTITVVAYDYNGDGSSVIPMVQFKIGSGGIVDVSGTGVPLNAGDICEFIIDLTGTVTANFGSAPSQVLTIDDLSAAAGSFVIIPFCLMGKAQAISSVGDGPEFDISGLTTSSTDAALPAGAAAWKTYKVVNPTMPYKGVMPEAGEYVQFDAAMGIRRFLKDFGPAIQAVDEKAVEADAKAVAADAKATTKWGGVEVVTGNKTLSAADAGKVLRLDISNNYGSLLELIIPSNDSGIPNGSVFWVEVVPYYEAFNSSYLYPFLRNYSSNDILTRDQLFVNGNGGVCQLLAEWEFIYKFQKQADDNWTVQKFVGELFVNRKLEEFQMVEVEYSDLPYLGEGVLTKFLKDYRACNFTYFADIPLVKGIVYGVSDNVLDSVPSGFVAGAALCRQEIFPYDGTSLMGRQELTDSVGNTWIRVFITGSFGSWKQVTT